MTGITDKFPDFAFVSFGGAGHALASSGMRPERGVTRTYDLKLRAAAAARIETLGMRPKLAGERVGVVKFGTTRRGFGPPHWMSRGTVEWQRRLASLEIDPGDDDLARRADAVLSKL